jgi:ABC-type glycerol-3-phosphate transport system permease component
VTRGGRALAATTVLFIARTVFVLIAAFPFIWMVLTSLKTLDEFFTLPVQWFPSSFNLGNYANIFSEALFLRAAMNSLLVAGTIAVFASLIAILAAYGFDRFRFRGDQALLFSIFGFQFFPLVVFLIPYFLVLNRFGLVDSLWGLWLAYLPLSIPLAVWMLRSFIRQVPRTLEEAALIDGCSNVGALLRVTIPSMRPQLIAVLVLVFVTVWDEYMMASILTTSSANRMLPVHLTFYMREMTTDWGSLMAASVVMTLPLVLPFVFLARFFQTGFSAGSIKG